MPDLEGRGDVGMTDRSYYDVTGICMYGPCRAKGNRCSPDGFCVDHCKTRHANVACNRTGKTGNTVVPPKVEYAPKPATLIAEEDLT